MQEDVIHHTLLLSFIHLTSSTISFKVETLAHRSGNETVMRQSTWTRSAEIVKREETTRCTKQHCHVSGGETHLELIVGKVDAVVVLGSLARQQLGCVAPIELQGIVTVGNKQRVKRRHSSSIAEPFNTQSLGFLARQQLGRVRQRHRESIKSRSGLLLGLMGRVQSSGRLG